MIGAPLTASLLHLKNQLDDAQTRATKFPEGTE